jgi:hypothetical protein
LDLEVPFRISKDGIGDRRYVAFVDILGFARKVRDNFDSILEVYQQMVNTASQTFDTLSSVGIQHDVSIRIYSDSFILVSEAISPLIRIVKGLHMITLAHDCLVRGGIGCGRHIEASNGNSLCVVSQALVQAVEVEKRVKRPCVALHESIQVPNDLWNEDQNPFSLGLMFYDGIRLVNPFSVFWGRTAAARISRLAEAYPDHRDKYEWFLSLYENVVSGKMLVP